MSKIVDIYALQSLPPSLINRDDTGSPKNAIFGGIPRQRVSSQSWKRAIRRYFEENFNADDIGDRSKRLPEKIARKLEERGIAQEEAIDRATQLFKLSGIKVAVDKQAQKKAKEEDSQDDSVLYPRSSYLLFLSKQQINRAVDVLLKQDVKEMKKAEAKAILDTEHSVDMAMFGRMVADDPAYNVDASVQVAHALGIHESAPEFDYFTAVDDLAEEGEETGAGMIGTIQMMSSTLYRYATVNLDGLAENLDSTENAKQATADFVEAFIASMPTGKINTFANQTLPELVYVVVRDTRPVSLVNAFESPIEADGAKGRREVGAEALAQEARDVENVYGFKPRASFVMGLGDLATPFEDIAEKVTLADLKEQLAGAIDELMGDE